MREKLNLDKPILTGFALWLRDVTLKGDFGTSASVDPGRPSRPSSSNGSR